MRSYKLSLNGRKNTNDQLWLLNSIKVGSYPQKLKNQNQNVTPFSIRTTHLNPALAETSPVSNCRGVIRRKGRGEALQSIEDMPELGGRGGEGCKTYSKTFNLHIHE